MHEAFVKPSKRYSDIIPTRKGKMKLPKNLSTKRIERK